MTPEAKKLLKDKHELCKEILHALAKRWYVCGEGLNESIEAFIKEHTTRDWKILSSRDLDGNLWNIKGNGLYSLRQIGSCSAEYLLEGGYASIHSVRRSDGEVFKVGDMIDQGKIESFRLLGNNEMEVAADTPCSVNLLMLKYATKLKPLFKTEDGVDVYEWDKYWLVNQYFEIITAHTDNNSKHFVLDPNTKA